jgi:DNA-binding transcriptional regulator YiaG
MTIARTLQDAATQAHAMPWTPASLAAARAELGLSAADLGRILRLGGRDPGRMVKAWESGAARIPGPVTLALEFMLAAKRRKQAWRAAPAASPEPDRVTTRREAPGRAPADRPASPTGQDTNAGQQRAHAPPWLDLERIPLLADEKPTPDLAPHFIQPAKRRRRAP